jgi:hypothetical protein
MFKRILTLVITLVAFCAATASAQGINGSFVGGVTDQTGAVVPEALLTATNTDTKVAYTAKTTSYGRYVLAALPVGTYQVEVTKAAFKTAAATNIKLDMQQTVTLDFKLEVGATSETVTVTTEAPLLDRMTAEVGDSMDDKTFHELPTILSGGLLDPQAFIFASLPGTVGTSWQGTINGGQQMATDVLVDGLTLGRFDINGDMVEDQPSIEAIGEFKLLANNYSAEFGGTSTGIESFEMKSGTNDYHGGLWEYHRNKVSTPVAGASTHTTRMEPMRQVRPIRLPISRTTSAAPLADRSGFRRFTTVTRRPSSITRGIMFMPPCPR